MTQFSPVSIKHSTKCCCIDCDKEFLRGLQPYIGMIDIDVAAQAAALIGDLQGDSLAETYMVA